VLSLDQDKVRKVVLVLEPILAGDDPAGVAKALANAA
jgi:hypothetical protein